MRDQMLNLLLIVLLTAISSFAHAQRSASAVMDVSVKIVKAGYVSADSGSLLTMDETGMVGGKLGSVMITGHKDNRKVVETQKRIELIDESGNRISFPLGVSKTGTDGTMNFKFEAGRSGVDNIRKTGTYSGTMTTKVEYL